MLRLVLETEVCRILSEDKKKVSEQAVLGERFPYTLHRIIEKGLKEK